jgi:ABC-2 type transport system ATP-binding protein
MDTAATSASATPAIAVERLRKVYKGVVAVDGISFALKPGTITGLLGGNGAGKTTTIAMIMGLVTPTSGTVTVLGADMPRERYRVLHRMNFESPYVDMPMRLTVRQNLTVFAELYGIEDVPARIASLAADLDLTEFIDRPNGKLSAGQKTRVALAKSLLNDPEVLLLDEPTASLDPATARDLRGRISELTRDARGRAAARRGGGRGRPAGLRRARAHLHARGGLPRSGGRRDRLAPSG